VGPTAGLDAVVRREMLMGYVNAISGHIKTQQMLRVAWGHIGVYIWHKSTVFVFMRSCINERIIRRSYLSVHMFQLKIYATKFDEVCCC